MNNKLDFIIIGAQKAGTTSLTAYLNENPDIFIPPEKEIPFFVNQGMQKKGWKWFMDWYFKKAKGGQLLGASTPQYMMYAECFKTIKDELPDVKLIAILRDPIKRLISHYDMACRFGVETRSLDEIIKQQLNDIEYCRSTAYNDKTGKYIVAGEYGRILATILKHFSKDQLLVFDFEELKRDPQDIVDQMAEFIGVKLFRCKTINQVRMKGGRKRRVDINHNHFIGTAGQIVRKVGLKQLVPDGVKKRVGLLSSWLDAKNVYPNSKSSIADIDPSLLEILERHFSQDQKILEELCL